MSIPGERGARRYEWRVAIVEDHMMQRKRTEELVTAQPGLRVVWTGDTLPDFLAWVGTAPENVRPHLLVLDLMVERGPSANPDVVRALTRSGIKVLVLSAMASPELVRKILRAGIGGIAELLDRAVEQGIGPRIAEPQAGPARQQRPFDIVGERIEPALRDDQLRRRRRHAADGEHQVPEIAGQQLVRMIDQPFGFPQALRLLGHGGIGAPDDEEIDVRLFGEDAHEVVGIVLDPAQHVVEIRIEQRVGPERQSHRIAPRLADDGLARRMHHDLAAQAAAASMTAGTVASEMLRAISEKVARSGSASRSMAGARRPTGSWRVAASVTDGGCMTRVSGGTRQDRRWFAAFHRRVKRKIPLPGGSRQSPELKLF